MWSRRFRIASGISRHLLRNYALGSSLSCMKSSHLQHSHRRSGHITRRFSETLLNEEKFEHLASETLHQLLEVLEQPPADCNPLEADLTVRLIFMWISHHFSTQLTNCFFG